MKAEILVDSRIHTDVRIQYNQLYIYICFWQTVKRGNFYRSQNILSEVFADDIRWGYLNV